ncbi:MAG: RsmB/NOP family class I SAM-dependent RNA methyltransferase, partial [Pseudomonadota bacterium]
MTPAARVQAAIEILDQIAAGAASEQALTRWARGARYAGSKDRAAVRDHVFDVVRCRRSYGARGGGSDGRALMIGALRAHQTPLDALFSGAPHAPAPLTDAEQARGDAPDGAAAMDLPDWLWPEFQTSLGAQAKSAARALQTRAGVHLRVNLARTTCAEAIAALATDGIEAHPHPAAETALAVTEGARKVRQAHAYSDGRVELQDAASQALALAIPVQAEDRFLDYCAGGG